MRRVVAISLVATLGSITLGGFTLSVRSARAATPAEVLCASYKSAVAKETDRAKRDAMIKSLPHGCTVQAAPTPAHRSTEPAHQQVQQIPEAIPEAQQPEPLPAGPPLPDGVSVDQALKNGNKAYQDHDYGEAMRWFSMSAGQGDAVAEDDVGELYFFGHGVPVDYAQAMVWYRRSAAQGNAIAQDGIGALYARGQGMPVNYDEALKWFHKSADQGNSDAANWLGYFYTHGLGVTVNVTEASEWYAKSREDKAAGR
jgi:TPR repeat protein